MDGDQLFPLPAHCQGNGGVQSLSVMYRAPHDLILVASGSTTCLFELNASSKRRQFDSGQRLTCYLEWVYLENHSPESERQHIKATRTTLRRYAGESAFTTFQSSYFADRTCLVCLSKDALTVRLWSLFLPSVADIDPNNLPDVPRYQNNLPDDAVPRALKPEGPQDVQVAWKVFCALRLSLVDEASLFHAFPMDLHGYLLGLFPNTKPLYSINASARVTSMHCSESKIELGGESFEHLILFATADHWLHAYLYNSNTQELERLHKARFGDGKDEMEDWTMIECNYRYAEQANPQRDDWLLECGFTVVTRQGKIQSWKLGKEKTNSVDCLGTFSVPVTVRVSKLNSDGMAYVEEVEAGFDREIVQLHEKDDWESRGEKYPWNEGPPIFDTSFVKAGSDDLDPVSRYFGGPITRLICSPDCSIVAVSLGCRVVMFEVATFERLCDWMCDAPVTDMDFNPKQFMIGIIYAGGYCLIDLEDHSHFKAKKVTFGKRGLSLAYTTDGDYLILGFDDNSIEFHAIRDLIGNT